jgi:hypothetical protein
MHNAIDHAKAVGTYNAMDRSRQYESVDNSELVRAVNESWTRIRRHERAMGLKDKEIDSLTKAVSRYRIANIALTSILTGLAWEGAKALVTYLAYR